MKTADQESSPSAKPPIRWCEKHRKYTNKCGCVIPFAPASEFDPDACLEEMRVLAKRIVRQMGAPGELPDITDAVELAERMLRLDKCLDNMGRLPARWMRTREKEAAFVDDPAEPGEWGN